MSECQGQADILLNRESLENMLRKARLEGALGYITYLSIENQLGKFKDLKALTNTLQSDALSASGAIATLLVQDLKSAGYENGLLDNLNEQQTLQ